MQPYKANKVITVLLEDGDIKATAFNVMAIPIGGGDIGYYTKEDWEHELLPTFVWSQTKHKMTYCTASTDERIITNYQIWSM